MKFLILIASTFLLGACSTTQVAMKDSREVPIDRALAFQNANEKTTSQIVVVRDEGIAASLCYYGVILDKVLSARLNPGERTTFYVEPGTRVLKIIRDPKGDALCSYGSDHVEKALTLAPKETQSYRLTLDLSGQPSLNPYVE